MLQIPIWTLCEYYNKCIYRAVVIIIIIIVVLLFFILKIHKNVSEQLMNNTVSAQIFLALWTLNPG